jgi:RNA polymerase sigma factor (TIGR02999 family)
VEANFYGWRVFRQVDVTADLRERSPRTPLAASYLRRERRNRDHTLQATALVNEVYLRMAGQHNPWDNRAHFFGIAAQMMRRILVDYARNRRAVIRGGGQPNLPLDQALLVSSADSQELLDLDLALSRLAKFDARAARVFELRFFGGLSVEETATVIGVVPRTVNRDWRLAQAWLSRELCGQVNHGCRTLAEG